MIVGVRLILILAENDHSVHGNVVFISLLYGMKKRLHVPVSICLNASSWNKKWRSKIKCMSQQSQLSEESCCKIVSE